MGLLDGKVALITGAAGGIGSACARRFAAEGALVSLVDVADPRVLAAELEAEGARALAFQCDVRDEDELEQAFQKTARAFGAVDTVLANAGINGLRAPLEAYTTEAFDRLISTNLKGTFLTARAAAPHLKASSGSLTLVSSVQGNRTYHHAGTGVYGASKAAVTALAKNLAVELGWSGVRVNTVCPGSTRGTGIEDSAEVRDISAIDLSISYPRGRPSRGQGVADPPDVADACLFLASDLSRHVSGAVLFVDGGRSLTG